MLGVKEELAKEKCMEVYKKKKRKDKRCICQSKKEVNKQFGIEMNQNISRNRKWIGKKWVK